MEVYGTKRWKVFEGSIQRDEMGRFGRTVRELIH